MLPSNSAINSLKPVIKKEIADGTEVTLEGNDYFVSRKVIDSDGWSIVLLTPTDRIRNYKLIGILATIFVCFLIMVFSGIIYVTDRSREAIRQSEELYKALAEKSIAGVYVVQDGKFRFINSNAASYAGYTREELLGQDASILVNPEDREKVRQNARAMLRGEMSSPYEFRIITKQGETRWIMETVTTILHEGRPAILGNSMNITERKRTEEALRDGELRYRQLFDNISSGVAIYEVKDDGNDFIFKDFNKAGERLDGDRKEDIVGKSICQVRSGIKEFGLLDVFKRVWKTGIPEHYPASFYEDKRIKKWFENYVYKLPTGDIVTVYDDVTERKQAEEKIQQMAYHDSLTGLPNRKLFSDRLGIALAQAQRNQKNVGIAMLDLDNFKDVNDTLGHDVGDLLLKAAAERLSAALRKGDTVARFGGDEFVLILPDLKVIEDAIQVAQKIVDSFRKPFLIDTHQLVVTTSIGIAVYPDDGTDEGILLKNADIAMYQAKQAGRDRYQLYKKA